jgi:hypothetical protein
MKTKTVKVFKTELVPVGSRKSFNRKAFVLEGEDGTRWLQSYDTVMCSVDRGGRVRRHSDWRSNTTDNHVKSFLATYAPRVSPAEFREMAVEPAPELALSI